MDSSHEIKKVQRNLGAVHEQDDQEIKKRPSRDLKNIECDTETKKSPQQSGGTVTDLLRLDPKLMFKLPLCSSLGANMVLFLEFVGFIEGVAATRVCEESRKGYLQSQAVTRSVNTRPHT